MDLTDATQLATAESCRRGSYRLHPTTPATANTTTTAAAVIGAIHLGRLLVFRRSVVGFLSIVPLFRLRATRFSLQVRTGRREMKSDGTLERLLPIALDHRYFVLFGRCCCLLASRCASPSQKSVNTGYEPTAKSLGMRTCCCRPGQQRTLIELLLTFQFVVIPEPGFWIGRVAQLPCVFNSSIFL